MAELATIARPYAEALYKAAGGEAHAIKGALALLAQVVAHPALRQFADDPKVAPQQVYDLVAGVAQAQGLTLGSKLANLLRTVIDNGRLSALGEVSAQYATLVNADSGVADALIESAFPIEPAQLAEVVAALERRFGRRLEPRVAVVPALIGGIRVQVGDEVLDTSVQARLQQMRLALAA